MKDSGINHGVWLKNAATRDGFCKIMTVISIQSCGKLYAAFVLWKRRFLAGKAYAVWALWIFTVYRHISIKFPLTKKSVGEGILLDDSDSQFLLIEEGTALQS